MRPVRTLLLAAVLLLAAPRAVVAQTVFAPTGAEWWYHVLTVGGPYLQRVSAVGDTALAGQPGRWQVLTVQHYSYAGGGAYYQWGSPRPFAFTQVRGDQVWAVTNSTERFYLDFGAGPGFVDSVANCTNGYSPQWIDSVGTETLNGQPVRIQWRRAYARAGYPNPPPTNVLVEYTGAVVERLGYPYAKMFPIPGCTTDPEYPELAYYHDAALSFGTRPLLVTGLRESAVARALRVAPNPSATGLFRLEGFTDARISYAVLDPQGRRVRAGQLTAAAPELNLTDLPAGLYLLRGAVDGHVFTRRLVRE